MSEQNGIQDNVPAIATALRERVTRAAAVQSEVAKKVGEINQHWLQRMQVDSNEAWQLLFKCGGTPAVGEKIKLCEQWIEGAMKKAAGDATYVLDSTRAIGELELRFFTRPGDPQKDALVNAPETGST